MCMWSKPTPIRRNVLDMMNYSLLWWGGGVVGWWGGGVVGWGFLVGALSRDSYIEPCESQHDNSVNNLAHRVSCFQPGEQAVKQGGNKMFMDGARKPPGAPQDWGAGNDWGCDRRKEVGVGLVGADRAA